MNAGNNFDIESNDIDLSSACIIKALALSGTELIGPGVAECACGSDRLNRLTTNASVKIVSANLPDFTPYVLLKKDNGRIKVLVTSVIGPETLPKDMASLPASAPVPALRRIQQTVPHDLFVVIINAGQETISKVMKQCPGIDLVIDGMSTGTVFHQGSDRLPPVVANNNEGMFLAYTDYEETGKSLARFSAPVQIRAAVENVAEDPDIAALVKEYDLKRQEILRRESGTTKGSTVELEAHTHYVGSQSCQLCHPKNNDCWMSTRHAGAMESLSAMSRQNDPDCLYCHVTGMGKKSSHDFQWSKRNHLMPGVQCEACHGPGADHARNPQDNTMLSVNENTCTRCHTKFKDPGFDYHRALDKLNCGFCCAR